MIAKTETPKLWALVSTRYLLETRTEFGAGAADGRFAALAIEARPTRLKRGAIRPTAPWAEPPSAVGVLRAAPSQHDALHTTRKNFRRPKQGAWTAVAWYAAR